MFCSSVGLLLLFERVCFHTALIDASRIMAEATAPALSDDSSSWHSAFDPPCAEPNNLSDASSSWHSAFDPPSLSKKPGANRLSRESSSGEIERRKKRKKKKRMKTAKKLKKKRSRKQMRPPLRRGVDSMFARQRWAVLFLPRFLTRAQISLTFFMRVGSLPGPRSRLGRLHVLRCLSRLAFAAAAILCWFHSARTGTMQASVLLASGTNHASLALD